MSKEDLVSLADRTEEERRRIATMGGKASGAARRAKREAIEREKIRQTAARELLREEIVALQQKARELRQQKAREQKAQEQKPCMPRMPRMPSKIPRGFWDL